MNKEQQELLDEAYENYCKSFENLSIIKQNSYDTEPITKQMFIEKVKNLDWFSEKWGLKIEERELSLEERHYTLTKIKLLIPISDDIKDNWIEILNEKEIPTKLITVTYNNETIERYE